MKVWLVYDSEGIERNKSFIKMHIDIGKKYDIDFELINSDSYDFSKCIFPKVAVVRTINPSLSAYLEEQNVIVLNNSKVSRICNNKGLCVDYIKKNTDITVPDTLYFESDKLTNQLLWEHSDKVIKAVDGHGGNQVFLTSESYDLISEKISGSDFIIQEYIKGSAQDVRVYVVANNIIGAVKREAASGFKSNYSLGGKVTAYEVDDRLRTCVDKIIKLFDFSYVGIDFLIDESGNYVFNEIEDVVGARMFYKCFPNIDILDIYIKKIATDYCI